MYTHTHTHTLTHRHTHTHYTHCWGKGQYCSVEMLREEKCLEFIFEGRENSKVSDAFGEAVPDVRTEAEKKSESHEFFG